MKNPRLLLLIGGILFLTIGISTAWLAAVQMEQEQDFFPGMIWLIVGLVLSVWGLRSLADRRRFSAKLAEEVTQHDQRPPVIYLRSFKDDQVAARVTRMGGINFISYVTEEEQLAEAMNKIGPLLAIGQPGEPILDLRRIRRNPNHTEAQKKRLEMLAWLGLGLTMGPLILLMPRDQVVPDLGAARMYVGDDVWQDKVKELLIQAQLVVLRAGETDNLLWEVQTVATSLKPEKILFLLPFPNRKNYDIFRKKTAHFFPKPFPETYKWKSSMQAGSVKAFLYFEPDWTPHIVPLKKPFVLFQSFFRPLVPILHAALRPVYQQLGLPYKRNRINLWIVGLFFMSILVMGLLNLAAGLP